MSARRAAWAMDVVVRLERCAGIAQDVSCCNHRQASSVQVQSHVDLRILSCDVFKKQSIALLLWRLVRF